MSPQEENRVETDPLLQEFRTFILTYAEHDHDCPGVDARAWQEHRDVCICGFAPRLDELFDRLHGRMLRHRVRGGTDD